MSGTDLHILRACLAMQGIRGIYNLVIITFGIQLRHRLTVKVCLPEIDGSLLILQMGFQFFLRHNKTEPCTDRLLDHVFYDITAQSLRFGFFLLLLCNDSLL